MKKIKVIVPLMAKDLYELKEKAKKIATSSCDIVEWRADYFEGLYGISVRDIAYELKSILKEKEILLTYRSIREGGLGGWSAVRQANFILENGKWFDYVDIEASLPEGHLEEISREVQRGKTKSILSKHNFLETPKKEELRGCLQQMVQQRERGSFDIVKIACMPKEKKDVFLLMEVAEQVNVPIIAISMGELGKISRVLGEYFGSFATFASVESISAPGQVDVEKTKKCIEALRKL